MKPSTVNKWNLMTSSHIVYKGTIVSFSGKGCLAALVEVTGLWLCVFSSSFMSLFAFTYVYSTWGPWKKAEHVFGQWKNFYQNRNHSI